jgi:hypothetical protein
MEAGRSQKFKTATAQRQNCQFNAQGECWMLFKTRSRRGFAVQRLKAQEVIVLARVGGLIVYINLQIFTS